MIGGNAALDFVNTASQWTKAEPVDRLGGPDGLADWAVAASLLDKTEAVRARREIARDPETAKAAFAEAVRLRGALWRIFSAVAAGEAADDGDLVILDACKVRAARCTRLQQTPEGFRRRCADETPALDGVLRQIVEAAEDLLLNAKLDRLHACGGEACDWMFLDLSKNGRRRWCSMATCGNDAKVRKFRRRKEEAA